MASMDGFQLLPLPEQMFLPSNSISGPLNFFIPSQPPLLQCLPAPPYTLMPGHAPYQQMGGLFPNQDLSQFYNYPNPSYDRYVVDASDKTDSLDGGDVQSVTSSQDRSSNELSTTSQPKDNWSWVEQLNYILRDIYRFCEAEKSVTDCQLILDILINSNREFFDLHSKLTAPHDKRKASRDSNSSQHSIGNIEAALKQTRSSPPTHFVDPHHSLTPHLTGDTKLSSLSHIATTASSKPLTPDPVPPLAFHVPDQHAVETQRVDSYAINSHNSSANSEFTFVNDPLSDVSEDKKSEKGEEIAAEVTPIIDPPQQLWSQVIQRSISHSSSRAVSPTPWLTINKANHRAYTTIADQRIELGPGFSTIYPSGVDHRLGLHSRNRQKQLSEKLASSNNRPPRESRETLEQRMAKAKEQRNKINEEKQDRLRLQRTKIKELQASKDEERIQRRLDMQAKLKGANDRRQSHLNLLRRKAQEEERKVSEIHLINQMGANSRKLELQDELERKQQYVTDRKEEIAQSKKQHLEKRIQSYNERKVQLQAEQDAKFAQKAEDRKKREIRQQQKRELQEKARQEEALSKDLTIERKKAVKKFIMQESVNFPKLSAKTNKKHKASKIESDIEKSIDTQTTQSSNFPVEILPFYPYAPSKICKICNTKLHSELYLLAHFRSSRHHEALENIENSEEKKFKLGDRWFIEDLVDTEETKSLSAELQGVQKSDKKKAKKIFQRLETNFPKIKPTFNFRSLRSNSSVSMQFSKTFTSLSRILSSQSKPAGKIPLIEENLPQLSEVKNTLQTDTKNNAILIFIQSDGLGILGELVSLISSYITNSYDKISPAFWQIVQTVINCFTIVAKRSELNCLYIVASSGYVTCLDIFLQLMRLWVARWGSYMLYYYQMQSPSHNFVKEDFEYVGVTETLFCLFDFVIITMKGLPTSDPTVHEVCLDLINYALSIGLMDQIFVIFNVVCGPMENTDTESIVLNSMEVLAILTQHLKRDCHILSNSKPKQSDSPHTLIFSTKLKQFPSMNVTSLLYSIVLHSGPPKPINASPPRLSDRTVELTTIAFRFINNAFLVNHSAMQLGVGSDETRVNEFKLLASYLIGYSKHFDNDELLHQLILSVGYFVLFSAQNQEAVQSGRLPTILQHLVDLPFKYFLSPELKNILFPTLIASTYDNENNRDTLKKEVNLQLLSVYIDQQLEPGPGIMPRDPSVDNQFDLKWRFPMEDINDVYKFYGIVKS